MIKLIATDMDGTLLDEHGTVPPETFDLIRALRERGVIFAASSGRRYSTLRWFFEPVADQMDYVSSLGSEVHADGQLIDREVFSYAGVLRLFEVCSKFDCLHLALYDEDHCYLMDDLSDYVREADKDLPGAITVDDPPAPSVDIIKAGVFNDRDGQVMDMAYVLERELGDIFAFMPSGERWIDVTPLGIDKASGIRQIMRYYGIGRDEVMAFGDSMNDYAILHYVGHPRVMSNARYALRQMWPTVGSNVEHAVQREMRALLESLD